MKHVKSRLVFISIATIAGICIGYIYVPASSGTLIAIGILTVLSFVLGAGISVIEEEKAVPLFWRSSCAIVVISGLALGALVGSLVTLI